MFIAPMRFTGVNFVFLGLHRDVDSRILSA